MRVGAERVGALDAVEQVAVLGAERRDPGPRRVDVHPRPVRTRRRATSRTGSIAPVPVVPTVGQTSTGRSPAARSSATMAASAAGSIASVPGRNATMRSARAPSPATRTALASDECVSAVT